MEEGRERGTFLVSRTSFYRAKKKLIDIGSVVEEDKRFKVVSPTRSHGTSVGRDEFSPTSPTTLKGGINGTKSGTSTPSSLAAAQAGRDRRLTLDQKEKIENLKANGWAESAARAQVLREDL